MNWKVWVVVLVLLVGVILGSVEGAEAKVKVACYSGGSEICAPQYKEAADEIGFQFDIIKKEQNITPQLLGQYDVLLLVYTDIDDVLFNDTEKQSVQEWVKHGGGLLILPYNNIRLPNRFLTSYLNGSIILGKIEKVVGVWESSFPEITSNLKIVDTTHVISLSTTSDIINKTYYGATVFLAGYKYGEGKVLVFGVYWLSSGAPLFRDSLRFLAGERDVQTFSDWSTEKRVVFSKPGKVVNYIRLPKNSIVTNITFYIEGGLEGIIKKDETLPGVIDNAVAVNYPPDNKIYIFGGRNCDVYGKIFYNTIPSRGR
jgi:hypothetical protein